ncbi:MAG: hypothetical protein ACTHKC_04200 [Candidatus Nitrosocosmicus sp.]
MTKIGKYKNLGNFNRSSVIWFVLYIGIAIAISFIIPFPLSLVFSLGIYLFLQSYRMESIHKQFYNDKDLNKGNCETNNKGYLKKFLIHFPTFYLMII